MAQHPDECPDSTILHDAALFLYEVHAHGWTELGPELRTRPAVAAFHSREWCSGCGALRTQHFSASNPDVPYHQVLRLPAQASVAHGTDVVGSDHAPPPR